MKTPIIRTQCLLLPLVIAFRARVKELFFISVLRSARDKNKKKRNSERRRIPPALDSMLDLTVLSIGGGIGLMLFVTEKLCGQA